MLKPTKPLIAASAVGAAVAAALVLTGPADTADTADTRDTAARAATTTTPVNPNTLYVVAISVDGLNPNAIRKLGRDGTPYLHYLMRNGAATLNARTAYEQTETLPNHTGMFTGRRINKNYAGHGVTFNTQTTTTVHQAAGRYTASVFDVVHDRGGSTALYTSKEKFDLYDRSYGPNHGAPDTTGVDHGRDKISSYVYRLDEDALVSLAAGDLKNGPRKFMFVHIADPDRTGHRYGFMTSQYLAAVKRADRRVGAIVNAIRTNATLKANTTLILNSDHGGTTTQHSDATKAGNYTIPFMAWGPRTPPGSYLYSMNTGHYREPGTSRPAYDGMQPIRNMALANLALDFLGMPSVPGSTSNDRQLLRAAK